MGITTSLVYLLVYHSFNSQYCMVTLVGILYLASKASRFSGVFTKLANLPILRSEIKKKKKNNKRTLFFLKVGSFNYYPSLYIGMKKRRFFSRSFTLKNDSRRIFILL